jgi:hypothetical protein
MRSQDVGKIKRSLKVNNEKLTVGQIYTLYLKRDSKQDSGSEKSRIAYVLYSEKESYSTMEEEKQEIYMKNLKKILSGTFDKNLFCIPFNYESETQLLLYNSLKADNIEKTIEILVDRIITEYKYETDVVFNACICEIYVQSKGNRDVEGEDEDEKPYEKFKFILATINELKSPDKKMFYDSKHPKFDLIKEADVVVNMTSPLDGLMYPSFIDGYADVNNIVYYTKSATDLNRSFVENVFDCMIKQTALDETDMFQDIISKTVGEGIKPEELHEVYEKLNDKVKESIADGELEDNIVVQYSDIKEILDECGIETVENPIVNENYQMKVRNIVPEEKKPLKVKTNDFDLSIAPKYLDKVEIIQNKRGKRCISIEIDDDVEINGLKIK